MILNDEPLKKLENLLKTSKKLTQEDKESLAQSARELHGDLQHYEDLHPNLVKLIQSITTTLSNLGI